MAVPFVGKVRVRVLLAAVHGGTHPPDALARGCLGLRWQDVPSEASEFAHPDVLIAATAIAYSIEGMRQSDVAALVSFLQRQQNAEAGPVSRRPA